MGQNDEESYAESQGEEDAVRQEKTVEGYVLDVEGNTITVDLENPDVGITSFSAFVISNFTPRSRPSSE